MTNRANRTLMVSAALTFALTATALAAGPLKGKTYEGGVPTSGTSSEGHNRLTLHAGGTISLRVSGNGSTVTVHFSSASPVLYCNTQKKLQVQKQPKPARISASGSFKASIEERFAAGPGAPSIVQVVSGRFSGRSVSGTIDTNAGECSGISTFSAKAH
jgi:hypothetical protein